MHLTRPDLEIVVVRTSYALALSARVVLQWGRGSIIRTKRGRFAARFTRPIKFRDVGQDIHV